MSTAIEFNHVSKQYRLGLVSTKTLSHDIRRFWITNVLGKEDPYLKIGETNDRASKGNSDYVWALRDIDFKVEQGDVVGIIGKNGAGKSTLLKLLSRVTGPTTGTIRAHGRIGSLLEVGTGFHQEMTGRENIFMNGAILGMTRNEIQAKLDEIIDFSGCERYIDTPVKRYSSGMTVRLGFAVAAFLEPEILVVDEVLAVGDAEFQKKAIGKMQDVSQGQGRTVLFVSHNMNSIKQLCRSGIVLKQGMVDFTGTANQAVDYYIGNYQQNTAAMYFEDLKDAPGNDKIRIRAMEVKGSKEGKITIDDDIHVRLQFFNYLKNAMIDCTFELRTADDICVFHRWCNFSPNKDSKEGEQQITFTIPKHTLNTGRYYFRVFFGENEAQLLWGELNYNFEVEYTNEKIAGLDDSFMFQVKPGIIRPELNFNHEML